MEELGTDALVHGAVDIDGTRTRLVVRTDGRTPPTLGQTVTAVVRDASEVHLFHPDTGARLTSA